MASIDKQMQLLGSQARAAAETLAFSTFEQRSLAVSEGAKSISNQIDLILSANEIDMSNARGQGLDDAMLDRLYLDRTRVESIASSLQAISELPDPLGRVLSQWERPSGLKIRRVTTPLGVIGVIYESRPNVTADAGALCLMAGNATILRGGSESSYSSKAIFDCLIYGLQLANLPVSSIQMVPTQNREAVKYLLRMKEFVDVIVPRGGKGLVGLVQEEARVPVFAHLEGVVHIYVDKMADAKKALDVVLNAKTRRYGICGAAECLLLHQDISHELGVEIINSLSQQDVELRVSPEFSKINGIKLATDDDWGREYLAPIMAVKQVKDISEAIQHISMYSSSHTDCIITEDISAKDLFFSKIDSAIVMCNASTQFADGGEFGLGAEIGIATGKMHARGPVGVNQLTSFKYLVEGNGAVRD